MSSICDVPPRLCSLFFIMHCPIQYTYLVSILPSAELTQDFSSLFTYLISIQELQTYSMLNTISPPEWLYSLLTMECDETKFLYWTQITTCQKYNFLNTTHALSAQPWLYLRWTPFFLQQNLRLTELAVLMFVNFVASVLCDFKTASTVTCLRQRVWNTSSPTLLVPHTSSATCSVRAIAFIAKL